MTSRDLAKYIGLEYLVWLTLVVLGVLVEQTSYQLSRLLLSATIFFKIIDWIIICAYFIVFFGAILWVAFKAGSLAQRISKLNASILAIGFQLPNFLITLFIILMLIISQKWEANYKGAVVFLGPWILPATMIFERIGSYNKTQHIILFLSPLIVALLVFLSCYFGMKRGQEKLAK